MELRATLLNKKLCGTITPEEAVRLDELNAELREKMRPDHEARMRRLDEMEAQIVEVGKRTAEIVRRFGL